MTITLTDSNFDELVLQSAVPVLVDFWADWCNPCRMVNPVIDALSEAYHGKAIVAKINVDRDREVAKRYGIIHIPALLIFKNGELVDRVGGPAPLYMVAARLDRQLA
jgi:thioredoxin 1